MAAFALVLFLTLSLGASFHVQTDLTQGSDFKTVYAAAASLVHGQDAYSFRNIAEVYRANGIVQPTDWYGRAPVYPPFTLVLLAPLTILSMVTAVYAWLGLSGFIYAVAIASLAHAGGVRFGLSRPWRMVLILLATVCPLAILALLLGNVSIVVAALCILAVTLPERVSPWLRAFFLALALLLKPHLALWVVVALLFVPGRAGRGVVARTVAVGAALVVVLGIWLAIFAHLPMQLAGYRAMLEAELGGGSMGSHAVDLVVNGLQITALSSLVGYFPFAAGPYLVDGILLAMLLTMVWATIRLVPLGLVSTETLVAAWCAFGMIATYHRAHDGTLLLLLLPGLMARLIRSWTDVGVWLTILCGAALATPVNEHRWWALGTLTGLYGVGEFMVYRQAALAAVLLALVLTVEFGYKAWATRRASEAAVAA